MKVNDIVYNIILLIVLFVLLVYSYTNFVTIHYYHDGFIKRFQNERIIEVILLFVLYCIIMFRSLYRGGYRTSFFFNSMILFLSFMPLSILFLFNSGSRLPLYALIFMISVQALLLKIKIPRISIIISEKKYVYLLLGLSIILFSYLATDIGLYFEGGDDFLLGLYAQRDNFSDTGTKLSAYISNILVYSILPISLAYCIYKKKAIYTFLIVFFFLYIFFMAGMKTTIVILVLTLFFGYNKSCILKALNYIYLSFIMLIIFGLLYRDTLFFSGLLDILVRRTFFTPALLCNFYIDFFSSTPLIWSYSFLKDFFDYPYLLTPPKVIGDVFLGNSNLNANSGLVAEGYMNLSELGLTIYMIGLAMIIVFFERFSLGKNFYGIYFVLTILIIESFFSSWFLTYGFIFTLFFHFIKPAHNSNKVIV